MFMGRTDWMLRMRSGSKVLLMVSPEPTKKNACPQSFTPQKTTKLCKPINKANTVPLLYTPNRSQSLFTQPYRRISRISCKAELCIVYMNSHSDEESFIARKKMKK